MPNANKKTAPPLSIFVCLLGLVIAFVIAVRLQFLHIGFERDEGSYCYIGQLVLEGKIPYLGFYEMKPPFLFYSYAALLFIFGQTVAAMHLAFLALNIITVILLYFVGKKWLHKRSAGIVTAASYAILSLTPNASGFTVQSEHIISFLLAASLLLLLSGFEKKRPIYFFLTGVLLCLAFLVKQNGIFFLAFAGTLIIYYPLRQKQFNRRQLLEQLGAYFAGALLILVLTTIILIAQGSIRECLFWTYSYARGYVSEVSLHDAADSFRNSFTGITDNNYCLWTLAALGVILPVFFRKQSSLPNSIYISLFAFISFLAVFPGFHFYGHYWLFFMPSVALLVAAGTLSIQNIPSKYTRNAGIIAYGLFGVAVLYNVLAQRDYYFNHNDNNVLRAVYDENPFPEAVVIGDYIKAHSTPSDSIAVIGSEPEIYFYTGLKCPSRHFDINALLSDNGRAKEFQQEYERDMEASVPRYFVYFENPYSIDRTENSDTSIFVWLDTFLTAKYQLVGIADMVSPDSTRYIWGNDVNNYEIKSDLYVGVFERIANREGR